MYPNTAFPLDKSRAIRTFDDDDDDDRAASQKKIDEKC